MALDFNKLPVKRTSTPSGLDTSSLPSKKAPVVKKPAIFEEDTNGVPKMPENQSAIKELGKTALRSVLKLGGTSVSRIAQVASSQLQAFPQGVTGALPAVGASLLSDEKTPLDKQISEIGRVSKEFHSDLSRKVEKAIEESPKLAPSERTKSLLAEGFKTGKSGKQLPLAGPIGIDIKAVATPRNAERALQLGADGFGSLTVGLALGALTGPVLPAILLSGIEGGQAIDEAEKAGKGPKKAASIGLAITAGTAISEAFGLDKLLNGSAKQSITALAAKGGLQKLAKVAKGATKAAIEGFATEGGTEAAQQVWQNLVKKVGYNPTQALMEGVLDSFVAGGLSGSTAGGAMSTLNNITSELKKSGVTDLEIEQAKTSILLEAASRGAEIDASIDKKLKTNNQPEVTEESKKVNSAQEQVKENRREFQAIIEENGVIPDETSIEDLIVEQKQKVGKEIETNRTNLEQARSEGFVSDEEFGSIVQNSEQIKLQNLLGIRKAISEDVPAAERAQLTEEFNKLGTAKKRDDIKAIYDKVQAISKLGAQRTVVLKAGRDTKINLTKNILIKQATLSDPEVTTKTAALKPNLGRLVDIETQSPTRYFDALDGTSDGSGVWNAHFNEKIQSAEDAFIRAVNPIETAWQDILKDAKLNEFNLSSKKMVNGQPLTLDNMMYIYASRKAPDNLAAVMFGNKISAKTVREVENVLTPLQKQTADKIAALYGIAREKTAETLLRVTDGKQVLRQVKGTYITLEREGIIHPTPLDQIVAEGELRRNMKKAKVKDSFKFDRMPYTEEQLPVRMELVGGLARHTNTRERFNAFAETTRDLKETFNNPELQETMRRHKKIGPEGVRVLERYLNLATDENFYRAQSAVAPIVDRLRSSTALAFLGLKVLTVLNQVTSYPLFAGFMKNPSRLLLTFPETLLNYKATSDFVNNLDPQMLDRTPEHELAVLKKTDPTLYDKIIKKVSYTTMYGIVLMDRVIALSGWKAVYDDALTDPNVTPKEAAKKARNSVLRTQSVAKFKDLPFAFNEGELRVLTLFASQLAQLNQLVTRDVPRDLKQGNVGKAAITASSVALSQVLLYSLVYGKPPTEPEEWVDFMKTQIGWLLPVVGPLVSGKSQGFDGTPSGLAGVGLLGELLAENTLEKKAKVAGALAGVASGLPVSGTIQNIQAAQQVYKELPEAKSVGEALGSFEGFIKSQASQKFTSKETKSFRNRLRNSAANKELLKGNKFKASLIKSGIIKG